METMTKPAVYTSITLLATILVAGQVLKSQVPATPPTDRQWEYASVTSGRTEGEGPAPGGPYQYFARAYTCYAASSGCGVSVFRQGLYLLRRIVGVRVLRHLQGGSLRPIRRRNRHDEGGIRARR